MHQLAGGNILNIETVTELSVREALTFLAYEKDVAMSQKVKLNGNSSGR